MCLIHMPMKAQKSPIIGKSQSVENEVQKDYNRSQDSSSDDPEIFFIPQPSTSHKVRDIPNIKMYMPYIEGPAMDWTVNDGLYNRFLKWKLKCENILECELAILPEARKCRKVLAWSGDFGLDQYTSWNLPNEDLSLEIIWKKFEEFCKPQANELRARFNLLTSFRQADMSVDEWYNAVQTQIALSKYLQKQHKFYKHTSFGCRFLILLT